MKGKYFDLRSIFERLNQNYFRGRLRGYKVMWGRRRKHRPKDYFTFGTIQEEDRVIRINPLLDQPFVPLWFLQYVLYHEMLHSVVPDEIASRWRRIHSHRRVQSTRAQVSELPARAPLGRRESRALPSLERFSAFPSRPGWSCLQTARGRRDVLFDQVPKRCREQQGDQLRPPVFQD